MKETIKYGFILGVICLLASGVLALVNAVTEPKIQLQKQIEEERALEKAMPGSIDFRPRLKEGKTEYYIAFDEENKFRGFVIKAEGKGYSSDIEIMAGLDADLNIVAIEVLSQNETPGLGSRIEESAFQNQFRGKNISSIDEVEAVTGATISSQAVIDSIKNKILELRDQLIKEAKDAK